MRLTEKYRPQTLDEIVGQPHVIKRLKRLLKRGLETHLLFIGPVGTGKTSTAMCIAREFFTKYEKPRVAGFEAEGKDAWKVAFQKFAISNIKNQKKFVRDDLATFASFTGRRVIFLDECDGMSPKAQEALRPIMETTKSTTFVLSCNEGGNISEAVKSRCSVFRFEPINKKDMLRRLLTICKSEGILPHPERTTPDERHSARAAIINLLEYANGDMRKCLNTLEQFITDEGLDYKGMLTLKT